MLIIWSLEYNRETKQAVQYLMSYILLICALLVCFGIQRDQEIRKMKIERRKQASNESMWHRQHKAV